jgi:alkylated DNA repair dioxygenase AlkB
MVAPDLDLVYADNFISDPDALFSRLLSETAWDERMRARKTASFGVPYNYSGMEYPTVPFPAAVAEVARRIEARVSFLPNNCLANYYADGDSTMGFHRDALDNLVPGTGVAIVSLGDGRTLTFRKIGDKSVEQNVRLAGGSLLYMPPEVQDAWRHGVQAEPGSGPRISLTFRCVIAEAASVAAATGAPAAP